MAMMRFKNKFDVAFNQMVLDAKKVNGVPKEIVVSPAEMWGVINEMRWSEMAESQFYVRPSQDFTVRRTFWSVYSDMPRDEANKIINQILRGLYTVEYNSIPLKVILPPKKPQTTENVDVAVSDAVTEIGFGKWPGFAKLFDTVLRRKKN